MSNVLHQVTSLLCHDGLEWERLLLPKNEPLAVTFVNPLTIKLIKQNPQFLDALRRFDYVFPDGILLAKIASHIAGRSIARLSFDGNSLAASLFSLCKDNNLKIGLVGTRPELIEQAVLFLAEDGLDISYSHSGFFAGRDTVLECYRDIARHACDIVIVGMGGGPQEDFALGLIDSGWQGKVFTCGGYFDQVADKKGLEYYPDIVNKLNLRAFYRVLKEPKKLIPRYTIDYWPFYEQAIATLFK